MRYRVVLMLTVSTLLLISTISALSETSTNTSELKAIFEKHCSSCHNGGLAPPFEGVIEKIKKWAAKYPSLDEAVRHEYTFSGGANSYDEMMEAMKRFTPTISDKEFKQLYEFFKQVFEEAKKGKGGATPTTPSKPTETVTATATPTTTTTTTLPPTPVEKYTTPPPTVTVSSWKTVTPYGPNLLGAVEAAKYVGLAVLIAAIVIALFLYRYRRM